MHASDPVHWRPWGPSVLDEARRSHRLILVALGYSACYWCHVMQRETWASAEVGRLVNLSFVPALADSEVNSALDADLQRFARRTRGLGGWPLTVFLTPQGYPLFAMTYAPKAEFMRVAKILAKRWERDGDQLEDLARRAAIHKPPAVIKDLRRAFLGAVDARADVFRGGFGESVKFPMVPQLAALLELQRRSPDKDRAAFLRLTLDRMARGGLRDHVAGGFFRYTVDPDWQRPHFEKMLSDNAQLAVLYLDAAGILKAPPYQRIGLQTLDFMLADMASGPGFVASLSAVDAHGREGGAYLWDKRTLAKVLGPRLYPVAARVWGLDQATGLGTGYLPQEERSPRPDEVKALAESLARLRSARAFRSIPRDDKLLAGWNGLALAAFSAAYRQGLSYREAAGRLFRLLSGRLWDGHRLLKGLSGGMPIQGADLTDYAQVAWGVARYASASGKPEARRFLDTLLAQTWRRFYDGTDFRIEEHGLGTLTPADPWEDGAVSAPAATIVRLTLDHGTVRLRRQAAKALDQASASGDPLLYASLAVLRN